MAGRHEHIEYGRVHRLTPAETALLEEYAKQPCLASIARSWGISAKALHKRSQSIRLKLEAASMQEAVEKSTQVDRRPKTG